jgi:CBS domain-containing protein
MFIKGILANKASQKVLMVTPTTTIQEAVADLSSHRVGVLVVSSDGKALDGVLSERDIVRELGRHGGTVLQDTAGNLMTKEVKTCTADDSAQDVLQTMTDGRFRHIPVMDGSKIVAMISIGDLVKARLDEIEQENNSIVEMIRG